MVRPIYTVKADYFKALANPTRIRILELLRDGERSVGDLVADLELEQSNVSQQLAVLRSKGIIGSRREGATVYYRVKDPRTMALLAVAKDIISAALSESGELLRDLDRLEFASNHGTERPSR